MEIEKKFYISPEQLRIGMFVILEMSWFAHNFTRNRFVIKNSKQIDTLKGLRLKQIRIDPSRSSLNATAEHTAAPATKGADETAEKSAIEKMLQLERINRQRAATAECEKKFVKAATTLKAINAKVYSQPKEAHREAEELIDHMLESLLTDKDVAVNLMGDKIGGEDMYMHSLNVTVLAMMLAKELGLPAEEIKHLGMGCLLHDIGKLEIPRWIVSKTTALAPNESALLQMHCQYGEPIAKRVGLSKEATEIVLQHHECVDGTGYPNKLKAEQISPLARIVAIANAFDNCCNPLDSANSLGPYAALAHIYAKERSRFDNAFLTTFIRCMGVYPPGTTVRLSDESYALVVSINFNKPLYPVVLVYDPAIPKDEALFLDLQNEPGLKVQEVITPLQLPNDAHEYLSPKKRTTYYFDVPAEQASS